MMEFLVEFEIEVPAGTPRITDTIAGPYGGERFGVAPAAVIRRDEFGFSWNDPLPSGEPALSNDVTLFAELHS
jgi:hypothetical protein